MRSAITSKISYTLRMTTKSYSNFQKPKIMTLNNVFKSPYKDVELSNCSLPEHIWKDMARWCDKPAIVCGLTNRFCTYYQLHKLSGNFAANLRTKLGVSDGDTVQIMLHNCPEYGIVVLGILQASAVVTTVHPNCTEYEIRHNLILSDPKLIIVSSDTVPIIKNCLILANKKIPIINVSINEETTPEQTISYQELTQEADLDVLLKVKRNVDDVTILPFSSGTSGLSKGIELTARSLATNFIQQDINEIKHYNDTTVLFLSSSAEVTKNNLDSLNKIVNGAAPAPKLNVEKMLEKTRPNTDFIQVYGSTESLLVTSTVSGTKDYLTSGYALPNTELKIIDQDGKSLGFGQVGELLIRGPQIMKGYRYNKKATEASISQDGWYKSGDLVKINKDGVVQIIDRVKEVIKVKGYQVSPVELENVLKEHPSIFDAGVIGVPHPRFGEVPKAFIVLKEGHEGNEEDIFNFLRTKVADYKTVKEIVFLKDLPKSHSGKLLRRILKKY